MGVRGKETRRSIRPESIILPTLVSAVSGLAACGTFLTADGVDRDDPSGQVAVVKQELAPNRA